MLSSVFQHRFNRPKKINSSCTLETHLTDSSASFSSSEESNALNSPCLLDSPRLESESEDEEQGDHVPMETSWQDFLLAPQVSQGRFSVPFQRDCRRWLKYLILVPIMGLITNLFFVFYWLPIFHANGIFTFAEKIVYQWSFLSFFLLFILPTIIGFISDVVTEITTAIMLVRGRQRRHLPEHMPRLTHAVIICNYKEPLDVLRATIESLAENTLAQQTMVILACEDRDPFANDTFKELEQEFSGRFLSFFKTTHKLADGEVAGKSSNENFACRELYEKVLEQGIDPFQVMVTTCDADSLFDRVFLEQVEAEYCRMPDGRRFLYNSPINTYRNLPECNFLVRSFEVLRCQYDTYHGITGFRPAQSNYSLTLGFAHEINYWDPSNTSEDFHSTLKAMAMTGKGNTIVVNVWSLILNDSVTSFQDRWVQAKRHMWGIEEVAFVLNLFPVLRLSLWAGMMGRVCQQMFGVCGIPVLVYAFLSPVQDIFFALKPATQFWIILFFAITYVYNWLKMVLREIFLYQCILSDRKLMMKRSFGEWLQICLCWPVMVEISFYIFACLATWRMLVHAMFHDTLVYVTAPKALQSSIPSSISVVPTIKPKKGA